MKKSFGKKRSTSGGTGGTGANLGTAAALSELHAVSSPRSSNTGNSSDNNQHQRPVDEFSARRSARISSRKFTADNDTWHENLAVVESSAALSSTTAGNNSKSKKDKSSADTGATAAAGSEQAPPLMLRSYFQSKATGNRVWDEPPSGASNVVYASEEVRRMAEIQMQDLQVSTPDVVRAASKAAAASNIRRNSAVDSGVGGVGGGTGGGEAAGGCGGGNKPRVLGRFKIGRKNSSSRRSSFEDADNDNGGTAQPLERRKIRYKPGRAPYGATAAYSESALDRDTRMAMMLSLQDEGVDGGSAEVATSSAAAAAIDFSAPPPDALSPRSGTGTTTMSEEEEAAAIAMAMAISLSEAEAAKAELSPVAKSMSAIRQQDNSTQEDEEARQLRLALELSKGDVAVGGGDGGSDWGSKPDPPEEGNFAAAAAAGGIPDTSNSGGGQSLRYRGTRPPSSSSSDDRKLPARKGSSSKGLSII